MRALSLADGERGLFLSVFPADPLPRPCPGILAADPSVTAALRASGVSDYLRASTRLVATLATAHQAARLRLGQPAALLRSTSLNADTAGRPVELGTTWFAGDRVALVLADS
jgi:GntR family phosphonate transport system transcriptional regulator